MSLELAVAVATLVVMALVYFASAQRTERQARTRAELEGTQDEERRLAEVKRRIVEEYAQKYTRRSDAGPHLLASLGLPQLRSDTAIRNAIQEIHSRTGYDPWEGYGLDVQDLNLLHFFEQAAAANVDFTKTRVSEFASRFRSASAGAA